MNEDQSITVNHQQAEKVLGKMVTLFKNNEFPFDRAIKPQAAEFLPKKMVWKSTQHARFLFYSCLYMRGAIKSYDAILKLTKIYERYPRLFNPRYYRKYSKKSKSFLRFRRSTNKAKHLLRQQLSDVIGYQSEQNTRFWIENSLELLRYWKGDPKKIFSMINDENRFSEDIYHNLCHKIIKSFKDPRPDNLQKSDQGFKGFKEKMASMLAYFFVDAGMFPTFHFPAPIDFHLLRLMGQHEVLVIKGYPDGVQSEKVLKLGREVSTTFCKAHNITTENLADALWLFSSTLCTYNPNNYQYKFDTDKKVVINKGPIKWTKAKERSYKNSCGCCPISETCVWNIPPSPYYDGGKVYQYKPETPPQSDIFSSLPPTKKKKILKIVKTQKNITSENIVPSLQLDLFKK